MVVVSMKDLLEAGVHFGHQKRKWNPKMKPYIYNERNGIHIIDLQQSAKKFQEAADFLVSLVSNGKKVLFVGTKKQAQDAIQEAAKQCSMYYINRRWPGGILTNYGSIKKSIDKYLMLLEMKGSDKWSELSKKEASRLDKLIRRLEKLYIGVKNMDTLPDAIIIIDPRKESIAVKEAAIMNIPVIAVVDTNCDPTGVAYVIPGNDDAIRAVKMFTLKFAEAINEGGKIYQEQFAEEVVSEKAEGDEMHEDIAQAITISEDYEEEEHYE
ncbi:MAG: 30S ribosomal protein S2 [Candidatus Fischerbacteria bacterium RBG_13_37_8]|uniref:Small ribosomal subunit protein uS2 n=1 Tax=Candidatus Fischerbacteria bacterium RBG_13_37_8 TaxID=1817863 RepID=A0A1F5VH06_9BACT|nr:MAG: 30S ribosomal protein S2 [Candidatus Fischerbacteria bacterium RBG_13_37_8]